MADVKSGTERQTGDLHPDDFYPDRAEGGYALAVSLIAVVVVTIIASAGWALSNTEVDGSRDYRARAEAFMLADRGLNHYLATDAHDLASPVTYDFETGRALVTVDTLTLGMANDESMYRVRSMGEHVTPADDTVRRTVSSVILATPLMPVYPSGSFVSGGGVEQSGNSATYTGYNSYVDGSDALCSEAGVGTGDAESMVADSFKVSGGGGGSGSCQTYAGATPDTQCRDDAVSEFMSADQWNALKDLEPDHVVAGSDTFPETDGYEVVKSSGDYELDAAETDGTGQGILIVEGDLTLNGGYTWDGLILVGGSLLSSNGNQTINGGIVTGLNELLGADPPENQIGNGTKTFQYNSCSIYKASTSQYRVSRVPSTMYESR